MKNSRFIQYCTVLFIFGASFFPKAVYSQCEIDIFNLVNTCLYEDVLYLTFTVNETNPTSSQFVAEYAGAIDTFNYNENVSYLEIPNNFPFTDTLFLTDLNDPTCTYQEIYSIQQQCFFDTDTASHAFNLDIFCINDSLSISFYLPRLDSALMFHLEYITFTNAYEEFDALFQAAPSNFEDYYSYGIEMDSLTNAYYFWLSGVSLGPIITPIYRVKLPECNCPINIPSFDVSCDSTQTVINFELDANGLNSDFFIASYNFNQTIDTFLYGQTSYSLPVASNPNYTYDLVIQDINDAYCKLNEPITLAYCDSALCDLNFTTTTVLTSSCDADSYFDFELSFELDNGSNTDVYLFRNSVFFESLNYNQFSNNMFLIEDIALGDQSPVELILMDSNNSSCADTFNFIAPFCDTLFCSLTIPFRETYCDGDSLTIEFEVDVQNPSANFFTAEFNGQIDTFTYGQNVYTLKTAYLPEAYYTLTVTDLDDINCTSSSLAFVECNPSLCSSPLIDNIFYCEFFTFGWEYISFENPFPGIVPTESDFEIYVNGDLSYFITLVSTPYIDGTDTLPATDANIVTLHTDFLQAETFYEIRVVSTIDSAFSFTYTTDTRNCKCLSGFQAFCDDGNTFINPSIATQFLDDATVIISYNNLLIDSFLITDPYMVIPPIQISNSITAQYNMSLIAIENGEEICHFNSTLNPQNVNCDTTYCYNGLGYGTHCDNGNTFITFVPIVEDTISSHFIVEFNGFVDTFAYGQVNYTIQVPGYPNLTEQLLVYDLEDRFCEYFVDITLPNCDSTQCSLIINENISGIVDCNANGYFDFEVGFSVTNSLYSGFDVFVNGNFFDYFPYDPNQGSTLLLEDLAFCNGTQLELVISDNDNALCSDTLNFETPFCTEFGCQLNLSAYETYCVSNQTYIDFEVENLNASSNSFTVNISGDSIASFPYGETFYTVPIPDNIGATAVFFIYDDVSYSCFYETAFALPNCDTVAPCALNIAVPFVLPITCNANGSFNIEIGLEVINGNNTGFDVFVDGSFFQYFPSYPNAGSLVLLEDLAEGNGQTVELTISDNDNAACFDTYTFTAPVCDTLNCPILYSALEVICDSMQTFVAFESFHIDNALHWFIASYGSVTIDTFLASASHLIPIPNNTSDTLVLTDLDLPNCTASYYITSPNCDTTECSLEIPIVELYCDGNATYLDFEVINSNTIASDFLVYFDWGLIDTFSYGETFYTVQLPNYPNLNGELYIQDYLDINCFAEESVTLPNCDTAACNFSNFQITTIDCIAGGEFELTLDFDFENEGANGFSLFPTADSNNFNGEGVYSYSSLPITIGPIPANGFTTYEIEITDEEFGAACQLVFETPAVSCLFPGNSDGDNEFKVNNCDVLYVGLNFNASVSTITNYSTTDFNAFDQSIISGFGLGTVLADCDGNGIVDAYDLDIITQNYTVSNSIDTLTNIDPLNGVPLFVDLDESTLLPGSSVTAPIVLGDLTNNANNFYGLAFSINYDTSLIESSSINLDFSTGWFFDGINDEIIYINHFQNLGRIDVALSLKDSNISTSGNGAIGEISLVLIEDIEGEISLVISDVKGISNTGTLFNFRLPRKIGPVSNLQEFNFDSNFTIYPTVVENYFDVKNVQNKEFELNLINSQGQLIYYTRIEGAGPVECSNFEAGNYIVKLVLDGISFYKKIIIY